MAVEVHQGTRNSLGRLAGFEGRVCGVLHGEGRRCGEDAHWSQCSRRCQGLRATLTRQKGSAGGGCPHRVLERAERDAEGGRRRGRAETAGRRWWRGRKHAVSCILVPRADSGRCCEGATGSWGVQESPAARNRVADYSPAGMARVKSQRGGAWAPGQRAWEAPWVHGGALARVCRGGGAAGWRERGGAEEYARRSNSVAAARVGRRWNRWEGSREVRGVV